MSAEKTTPATLEMRVCNRAIYPLWLGFLAGVIRFDSATSDH